MNINNHLSFPSFNQVNRSAESIAERMDKRFTEADADQSGSVTFAEMQAQAGDQANIERLERIFDKADLNGDGEFTRAEQMQIYDKRMDRIDNQAEGAKPDRIASIKQGLGERMNDRFQSADTDQSGSVSFAEMQAFAPNNINLDRMEAMFNKADADADGEISQEEHMQVLDKRAERVADREFGKNRTGEKAEAVLLELAQNQMLTEEQQTQIQDALSNLDTDQSRQSIFEAAKLIRSILPSVSVEA